MGRRKLDGQEEAGLRLWNTLLGRIPDSEIHQRASGQCWSDACFAQYPSKGGYWVSMELWKSSEKIRAAGVPSGMSRFNTGKEH